MQLLSIPAAGDTTISLRLPHPGVGTSTCETPQIHLELKKLWQTEQLPLAMEDSHVKLAAIKQTR